MITQELAYNTWQRCGSVVLAAQALNTTQQTIRRRVVKYLESIGEDIGQISPHYQLKIINEVCRVSYTNLREMLHNDAYGDGVAVYDLGSELVFSMPGRYDESKLVGIYQKGSHSEDIRDDLYWYITTQMETNDDY